MIYEAIYGLSCGLFLKLYWESWQLLNKGHGKKKMLKNEGWTDLQLDFKKLLIELVQNIICDSY